jgi:hypothetical protein
MSIEFVLPILCTQLEANASGKHDWWWQQSNLGGELYNLKHFV